MIEKSFEITMSHKLPTGDIISVRFGTKIKDQAEYSEECAKKVFANAYASTILDIKEKIKKDKLVKTAYKGIQRGIKVYETEQDALSELEKL